jgi:hypothetical protein
MADFQVPDKDLLTNVDRAADSFLLYDNSATKLTRTTVNNALNVTSQPVGIDDVQTLTNKTLTSPAMSSPILSGTTTGTYTLGGNPTFPSTVVTTTGVQTLANKTLTSPTVNNATISNPTITVDTISEFTADNGVNIDGVTLKDSTLSTDTISEKTLNNGVTVDGLNIKDGKLNTNNSVITANITDGAVTKDKLATITDLFANNPKAFQTGTFTINSLLSGAGGGVVSVTFPTAFDATPLVFLQMYNSSAVIVEAHVSASSATGFSAISRSTVEQLSQSCRYFAIDVSKLVINKA